MISPLSARWLWHLLREGIFAKDRKLLDHICSKGGTRYDLAFVFFLFGFDSSEIERLLKYNQLVRYEQLQQIREAARGSQTLSKQPISLPTECLRSASLQTLRGDGRFQVLEQANATLRRRLAAEAEAARRAAEDRPRRMPGP